MNTSKNNTETSKDVLFVDALHESLVANKIITNPRVIQCGTYFSKERGYDRYRVKCGNIKECPRCRTVGLSQRRQEMLSEQELCLIEGGFLFMITRTLKHKWIRFYWIGSEFIWKLIYLSIIIYKKSPNILVFFTVYSTYLILWTVFELIFDHVIPSFDLIKTLVPPAWNSPLPK